MNKDEIDRYKESLIDLNIDIEKNLNFIKEANEIQNGLQKISEQIESDVNLINEQNILFLNFLISRADFEINLIQKSLIEAKTKWERIYFIKLAHLNIYEVIKAYNQQINVIKKILPKKEDEILKELNKFLNNFKKKYSFEDKMKIIRNNIIGHYDIKIDSYYEIVEKFDLVECLKMCDKFSIFLTFLLKFVSDLHEEINKNNLKIENFEEVYEKLKIKLTEEIEKLKNIS